MGNVLNQEQLLRKGESLKSENGEFTLDFQEDGNLVVYRIADRQVFFASNTNGKDVDAAKFQADGNFVVYYVGGKKAAWASNTHSNNDKTKAVKLQLENTGAVCLYDVNDKVVYVINSQRWMSALNDSLTLNDICMPGSHDAGMYCTTQDWAPGLALTQSMNFRQQLDFGIRYFDLRPQYWSKNHGDDRFYAYHGLATGPLIINILDDVRSFFEHPNANNESVIISISQFKDFTKEVKIDFFNLIIKHLDKFIYKLSTNKNLGSLKLSEIRGKIIFLLDVPQNEFIELSSGNNIANFFTEGLSSIFDKYSETKYYETMYKRQEEHFKTFNENKLFLLNWTLTADDGTWGTFKVITQSYTSVKTYAKEINPHLLNKGDARNAFFKPNQHGKIVNIINGDFWELSGNDVLKACFEVMNNK